MSVVGESRVRGTSRLSETARKEMVSTNAPGKESDGEVPKLIEIVRSLEMIVPPGQVTELRALGVVSPAWRAPHIVSGYFNDLELLAESAVKIEHAAGIYFMMNPINPALLARSQNRARGITSHDPTTSDEDIEQRRFLLIDIDPMRPSGISASEEEHNLAHAKALEIRDYLRSQEWPDPVLADSGNGAHLLYRVDLPADDGHLVGRTLQSLAFLFDESGVVSIDQSVDNAARIIRLYGTYARKGDNTEERPHRRSCILEDPGEMKTVSRAHLDALAAMIPVEPVETGRRARRSGREFDLDDWIRRHGLAVVGPKPWNRNRKWVFDVCPWNSAHTNRSAYIVQFVSGGIAAGCHHNGCADENWGSLRNLCEPEWREGSHRDEHLSANGNGRKASPDDKADGPKRFWEGQSFRPALLADELMEQNRYLASPAAEDGVGAFLYAYQGGVFRRAEMLASKSAETLLEVRASNARIDDAVKLIRRRAVIDHESLNPKGMELINVCNGMLDWRNGRLIPHAPKYLSTIRIPVLFDPLARSETIERVLGDWFPGDALELAGEMLGYLLLPTRKYQVAVMLVGQGENGKSTFINLVRMFLGRGNVSTETLHDLEENRFRAASLYGKLANLCADIDERALRFSGMFKKITGDDSVAAERKHQHPFDFDPYARLVFSANNPPAPRGDRTHAFFRRWVIVPFDNTFRDGTKRDRNLLAKITVPEALSALLNIALAGLQRLEERSGFELPESVRRAGEKYRRDADRTYTFIMEEVSQEPDAAISANDLYRRFKGWCSENGYVNVPPKRAFEDELVEVLRLVKGDRARVGGGKNPVAVWRGITCSYSPTTEGTGGFEEDRW